MSPLSAARARVCHFSIFFLENSNNNPAQRHYRIHQRHCRLLYTPTPLSHTRACMSEIGSSPNNIHAASIAPASSSNSSSNVAICFSGWLGVIVPSQGYSARIGLVEPLKADVFVAAMYRANDCLDSVNCTEFLWSRIVRLRPFAAATLERLPTRSSLQRSLKASKWWTNITSQFRRNATYNGLTIFSPVLGTRHHLLQLISYESVYNLVCQFESIARNGTQYEWLVYSRFEYQWLAPHPPLTSFDSSFIWTPNEDSKVPGINDRHAVLPRSAGRPYFTRWSELLSHTLFPRFRIAELVTFNPESFLKAHLLRPPTFDATASGAAAPTPGNHQLGSFPLPAYLVCCDAASMLGQSDAKVCWAKGCHGTRLFQHTTATAARISTHHHLRDGGQLPSDTLPISPTLSELESLTGAGTNSEPQRPDFDLSIRARGKYPRELRDAVHVWQWMQCSAQPRFHTRLMNGQSGHSAKMLLVVPAGELWLTTDQGVASFVLLNRSFAAVVPSREAMRIACPLAELQPLATSSPLKESAAPGWCAPQSVSHSSAGGGAVGVAQLTAHSEKRLFKTAIKAARSACGKGSEEQTSLIDCALTCTICSSCKGFSFSLDFAQRRQRDACTLHVEECGRQKLRSPSETSGWDVVSLSRTHALSLFGPPTGKVLQALRAPPASGLCGFTGDHYNHSGGDCGAGSSGSWLFGRASTNASFSVVDEVDCVRHCIENCPRCRYVSVSALWEDCSWYHACPTIDESPSARALRYKTYSVHRDSRPDASFELT